MSSYPLIKYVDAPAVTATVRYDFNDQNPNAATGPAKKVTEFDPGVPTLEGDPDAVGQAWGFRGPSITHTIRGTKAQAMAALSLVSREQLRRTNWLMFQPSAAMQPVWFKTYRTGYQPITLDRVYVRVDGGGTAPLPDTWEITVPIVADAFAYGARATLSTVQIVQSPADLAGPTRYAMHYVLPTIKGEAPTPLRVTISPGSTSGGTSNTGSAWAIGCIAGSSAMSDPVLDIGIGDGLTAGSGTGAGVSDSAFFGGSYRLVTIGAAQALTSRLSGSVPSLPAGRYKVMLRYEATGSTSVDQTYLLQWKVASPASSAPAAVGAARSIKIRQDVGPLVRTGWVDLGEFSYPIGAVADDTPPGQAAPATGFNSFDLLMTTSGVAGSIKIDALKFIPVTGPTVTQATFLTARFPYAYWPWYRTSPSVLAVSGTFDADTESYWSTAVTPSAVTGLLPSSPQLAGAFPVADPVAQQNMLIVMATDLGDAVTGAGTGNIVSKDAQLSLDVSYYPRYLHVGDGT